MISTNEALEYLFDDTHFNFRDFLLEVSTSAATETSHVQLIINTVELFAFGDLRHYTKYHDQFVELPAEGLWKLAKLTVISICNENEGGVVSFDALVEALKPALHNHEKLECLLISMVDQSLIGAKIDEGSAEVEFVSSSVQRDAYNSEVYELRVLNEHEDIPRRSVGSARQILQRWLDEQIVPARNQLQQAS